MLKFINYQFTNLYAALFAFALLIGATYLQVNLNIPPCPLCVMQRIVTMALGLLFLTGVIYIPRSTGRKIINGVILGVAILGIALASRHVYLQHLPVGQVGSCSPGLNFIFANLPLGDAIKVLLLGSGKCANIHWAFLGLSIPEWSLISFVIFAVIALIQFRRKSA